MLKIYFINVKYVLKILGKYDMSFLNIIDIKKWKIIFKNLVEIVCGYVILIVKILFFILKNG